MSIKARLSLHVIEPCTSNLGLIFQMLPAEGVLSVGIVIPAGKIQTAVTDFWSRFQILLCQDTPCLEGSTSLACLDCILRSHQSLLRSTVPSWTDNCKHFLVY